MSTRAKAIRRRVQGWREAERRERSLRSEAGPLEPAAALHAALELCELRPTESLSDDFLRAREVEDARAAWQRLRARMPCPPIGPRRS